MTRPLFAINPFVTTVEAPPIPTAQAWRAHYDGSKGAMIDLSQAVPGNPPPDALLERIGEAARTVDASKYGPILGDAVLREAHAQSVSRFYGGLIQKDNIAITSGCNQAFVVTMMALARAGDAVLLPAPWYFNHKMTLDMLGIEPRVLPCHAQNGFVPSLTEAEALLQDGRVKAMVLVSPNNPTGAIYPPDILAGFAALALKHRLPLVLDETYRDFLPEGVHRPHDLFIDGDWADTLIQLYSFSKAYALPGHRLGSIIAAASVIKQVEKILDSLQICPARAAQGPVSWAIEGIRDWREAQRTELLNRAKTCKAVFAQLNGWKLHSIGAYFAFASHPFTGLSAVQAAEKLALAYGILTLPGPYFGPDQEHHLRIAFANVGVEAIEEVGQRLR